VRRLGRFGPAQSGAKHDEGSAVRPERLALLSDRAFVRFFLAHTLSFLGTRVSYLALPLLMFELTGSALQTALLLVLATVPYLLFGLFAGARFAPRHAQPSTTALEKVRPSRTVLAALGTAHSAEPLDLHTDGANVVVDVHGRAVSSRESRSHGLPATTRRLRLNLALSMGRTGCSTVHCLMVHIAGSGRRIGIAHPQARSRQEAGTPIFERVPAQGFGKWASAGVRRLGHSRRAENGA
jgi:hypothetical protein